MLEARNISRTYKPKKGGEVKALSNVSLKFPETGMVFLLGKSGSGKSTLLNLLGGLDKYDEGDIIIKGKSSSDFKQSEFDSYRNTYLGFIFQEYNILEDFTVNDNIGLALQLQGKKATREAINAILNEVDLEGLGDRKPGELSGGQRQRVAIARALVKGPEIILADEPTGALDSKTGLQVFDTLKKLSKDKLVLVVTHDREFAEQYGDRVIELKDGRVISDIEKYMGEPEKLENDMTIIDNKIILLEKGRHLKVEDLAVINKHLEEGEALISIDSSLNSDVKKLARVDEKGRRKTFKNTDEGKIKIKSESKFKLIRSRLPFKHSLRIGASSLKTKPFRLVLTILLSMIAFSLFGLADTAAAYNKYKVTETSFIDSNINSLVFKKTRTVKSDFSDFYYDQEMKASEEDLIFLNSEFENITFEGIFIPFRDSYQFESLSQYFTKNEMRESAYTSRLSGLLETDKEGIISKDMTLVGKYPSEFNEIAITKYTFEHFKEFGYSLKNDKLGIDIDLEPKNVKDELSFLNKHPVLIFDDSPYTITAIIDTKFNLERYKRRFDEANDLALWTLIQELSDDAMYGMHSLVFVKKGFLEDLKETGTTLIGQPLTDGMFIDIYSSDYTSEQSLSFYPSWIYNLEDVLAKNGKIILSTTSQKLQENSFLVDLEDYIVYLRNTTGDWADIYMYNNKIRGQIFEGTYTGPNWFHDYIFGLSEADYIKGQLEEDGYKEAAFHNDIIDMNGESDDWESFFQHLVVQMEDEKGVSAIYYAKICQWEDWKDEHADPFSSNFNPAELRDLFYRFLKYSYHSENENTKYTNNENTYLNYKEDWVQALTTHRNTVLDAAIDSGEILTTLTFPTDYKTSYMKNYYGLDYNYDIDIELGGLFAFEIDHISLEEHDNEYFYFEVFHLVLSDNIYSYFEDDSGGIYDFLIADMPTKQDLTDAIKFSYDYISEDNISYSMKNSVMTVLSYVNTLLEQISKIFMYIGIGFALFSALLLMNYITISIINKKSEIGILRAVGAKSSDVFGIFFSESMLIALINFFLATIAVSFATYYINLSLRENYNISITFLNFGIRQILLLLALSTLVAAAASFFPVYKTARKRPIDAIRK